MWIKIVCCTPYTYYIYFRYNFLLLALTIFFFHTSVQDVHESNASESPVANLSLLPFSTSKSTSRIWSLQRTHAIIKLYAEDHSFGDTNKKKTDSEVLRCYMYCTIEYLRNMKGSIFGHQVEEAWFYCRWKIIQRVSFLRCFYPVY